MKRMLIRIFSLGITLLFFSCKTWDATQIEPKADPIKPKLPALERSITDYANAEVVSNEDEMEIFTKEVEKNLTDPYGDKYGYITFQSNYLNRSQGVGFYLLNIVTLGVPSLFGVPWAVIEHRVEVTIKILDVDRNLITKYSNIGLGKNYIAYYYGYSGKDAHRKTAADAHKSALKKIREQIDKESKELNKKLKEKGPMN